MDSRGARGESMDSARGTAWVRGVRRTSEPCSNAYAPTHMLQRICHVWDQGTAKRVPGTGPSHCMCYRAASFTSVCRLGLPPRSTYHVAEKAFWFKAKSVPSPWLIRAVRYGTVVLRPSDRISADTALTYGLLPGIRYACMERVGLCNCVLLSSACADCRGVDQRCHPVRYAYGLSSLWQPRGRTKADPRAASCTGRQFTSIATPSLVCAY